jgi:thiol-disulfide isomerase/thioredoxin
MKLIFQASILFFFVLSCAKPQSSQETQHEYTYHPPVIFEEFEVMAPLFEKQNDTIYVINFWATWCKPCVEELPYFEELHNRYKGKKVKVLLVSLDFPDQIDKKLIPFIKEKQLNSEVVILTDGDANNWIPKIAEEWSGAIPATLVYDKNKRSFHEQSFETFDELNNILKQFSTF